MSQQDKTNLGRGYGYSFAIMLTALLCWQSIDFKYNKTGGLEVHSKDVPMHVLGGYVFLVASSLGFNTDAIAIALGNALSQGRKVD